MAASAKSMAASKADGAAVRAPGGMRAHALSFLFVFAGFTLTSTTYLAWLYNLMGFGAGNIEALTIVGGYGFQALGLAVFSLLGRRWPDAFARVPFLSVVALHFLCAVPAMMGQTFAGALAFGFMMNAMCGAIAACYLRRIASDVREGRRGLVFGGAYACSTLASWLLSLVPGLQPANSMMALIPCVALSVLAVAIAFVPAAIGYFASASANAAANESIEAAESDRGTGRSDAAIGLRAILPFACIAILLMSLVNNVGFGFPTADIAAGVNLELSRLFYAVGLVIAGIVIDRSLKHGAICCVVAMAMPFALMALSNEPVPAMVIWGLNYLFAGFFSVFRVVLFADIASGSGLLHLACVGLAVGRVGDALGTGVYLTLGDNAVALVCIATVLFAAAVFVVYRLGQLVAPDAKEAPRKTEQELISEFAARYGLSAREQDVLVHLVRGSSNAEIAAELFVSESTVKFHVHNLLKKTGCKSRNDLRDEFNARP